MFIKYNDENNTQIEINSYEFVEYPKIVRIYSNTKLDNLSGFNIYENEEVCLYDFPEFKYIYDSTDTYTDYINEYDERISKLERQIRSLDQRIRKLENNSSIEEVNDSNLYMI